MKPRAHRYRRGSVVTLYSIEYGDTYETWIGDVIAGLYGGDYHGIKPYEIRDDRAYGRLVYR